MADAKSILAPWAHAWREEHVTKELQTLINLANWDLYYGPTLPGDSDETADYPGFTTACKRIADALDDLPSSLYVDDQSSDCYSESEPEPEECPTCEGTGTPESNGQVDDDGEDLECPDCCGRGQFEPGEYWRFDRRDLKVAIVGKELAGYV
jgi:hypothetical protein